LARPFAKLCSEAARRPLLVLFIGTAVGILARESMPAWPALFPAMLSLFLLRGRPIAHWGPLLCAGLAFGLLRVPPPPSSAGLLKPSSAPVRVLDVEAIQISLAPPGDEPWEPGRGFVVVDVLAADGRAVEGRLRVSVGSAPPFEAGQRARLYVSGIRAIASPTNPGQPDLAKIWGRAGIVGSARLVAARMVDRTPGPRTLIERFRLGARDRLYTHLEPRDAGVIAGLVLGFREGIPPELADSMRRTGTTHLIVISGMHFGLVLAGIGLLVRAAAPLRRWWAIALAWGAAYAVLAGLTIPVLRAFSMAAAYWCASAAGRRPDSMNLLAGAALLNLVLDPAGLFTLSFQLSFLAVAAILLVAPRLEVTTRNRWLRPVSVSAAVSAACTLATMPLIAMHFGGVTPGVCVANLVMAPLASATIVAGFAALTLGSIPLLGDASCAAVSGLCQALASASAWFAELPGSFHAIVPPGAVWVLLFYVALGIWCLFPLRAAALALPAILLVPHWSDRPRDGIVVLDVGDGIAVVAHRQGATAVFADSGGHIVRSYLASRGIDRVDLWVRVGAASPTAPAGGVVSPGDPAGSISIGGWRLSWAPVGESRWARSAAGRAPPPILVWAGGKERIVLIGKLGSTADSILCAEGFEANAAVLPAPGGRGWIERGADRLVASVAAGGEGVFEALGPRVRFTSREGAVMWKPPR
jgi:ComEC/Rec2-related protein